MSLNIKNERVHELAREAARVTGQTQTGAIEAALVAFLAEHDHDRRREEKKRRMQALLEEIDASMTDERRASIQQAMDELYDENGLPVR